MHHKSLFPKWILICITHVLFCDTQAYSEDKLSYCSNYCPWLFETIITADGTRPKKSRGLS